MQRSAIESAFDTQQKKDRFTADTVGKSVKRVYDEIQKRLDPLIEQIAAALNKEDISAELSGIFDLAALGGLTDFSQKELHICSSE